MNWRMIRRLTHFINQRINQVALAGVLLALAAAAAGESIHAADGAFQVTGWKASAEPAAGWSSVFQVYAGAGDIPAMLGGGTGSSPCATF
jgi:hypothetical protein